MGPSDRGEKVAGRAGDGAAGIVWDAIGVEPYFGIFGRAVFLGYVPGPRLNFILAFSDQRYVLRVVRGRGGGCYDLGGGAVHKFWEFGCAVGGKRVCVF